jgi:predicted permease
MESEGLILVFAVLLGLLVFISRPFISAYVMRRRQAGQLSGQRAAWLYGTTITLPYIALMVVALVVAPEAVPILLLAMALAIPVFIIAWVAIYR